MILSDRKHKASKIYQCDECGRLIAKGETYHRLFGGFDRSQIGELIICHKCKIKISERETAYQLDVYEIEAENEYLQSDDYGRY